jgi:hypothetical protein
LKTRQAVQSKLTVDERVNREARAETEIGLPVTRLENLRKPCGGVDEERRIGLMTRAVTAMN